MSWVSVHRIGCDVMEFIRVNDNMIKCLVSEEDMDQYDVSIEDFFTRSENAMELLHEIVKQAAEEVGYKPQGPLTSLQIAPVDEHGLAIFLTEKSHFDLQAFLKGLKKSAGVDISDEIMDIAEDASDEESMEYLKRFMENVHKELENCFQGDSPDSASYEAQKEERPFSEVLDQALRIGPDKSRHIVSLDCKIFAFDRAAELLEYARVVEMPEDVESRLYKDTDHGTYYLIVNRNDADVETLAGVYLTAYEYGHFVSEKPEHASFIKEHCECLITNGAIQKMKG